ncbi:linker for activation of T-cells family member 1 isoform X3 [Crotalus tigris]|uniref:linker for activation of T-cells family member 1 isoform X3 n=1 Tax=Crotalus tigris TaxID=88082 RepID=UPI00192FA2BE|nr:linker for activation of T-cells family member 1 isoform X3 [Crotalus tigris]
MTTNTSESMTILSWGKIKNGKPEFRPSTNIHSQTFRVLRRPPSPPWSAILSQPDLQSTGSAYSLCSQTPAFIRTEDNESVPSYENEEPPFVPDDDDNYIPGYIVVLPDVPITEQRKKDHASSESILDQYENVPESQRHSLGEYVNVLEPAPIILDPCFAVGTSDRESEDDVPDYENVCFGL